jgi:predicted dehydrogenase
VYNVAIYGAGNKGALADAPGTGNEHKFLSYAHAVNVHRDFQLCRFIDILPEMKEQADRIWKPADSDRIDVVIIATPDEAHFEHLFRAVELKPKLVICEKPLCTNIWQAEYIVNLYKEKNIPILVDYTRRFIHEFQIFKQKIDDGITGKFLKGYLYFNRGWEHTASHFIDLVLWFNGNMDNIKIEEVKTDYRWVFQWGLFYENDFISEHAVNFVKEKVSSIYDNHLYDVMDNAVNYFMCYADLLCTGEDALRAVKETIRLKGENK